MICMPLFTASCSAPEGLWGGAPIDFETIGLAPTSIHASAPRKGCGPAAQRPCSAIAIALPGLSMVAGMKRMGEPIAFIQAMVMGAAAGTMNEYVPT